MKTLNCPKGHGPMEIKIVNNKMNFRGVDLLVEAEAFVCPECNLEAGNVKSAGEIQRKIADSYRAKKGLLTGQEIKSLRETRGLTQQQLADAMKVGIASIKRWETGMIQSKSMDYALRMELQNNTSENNVSGNREISLSRIKLVALAFERILGKRLLISGDQFLFLAKYLWYADLLAFRHFGKGLTGASYASLPFGPQLNNYKDLVKPIKESKENASEPLSEEEIRVIQDVARKFPHEQDVYDASHREKVWHETPTGALIPYSRAHELTEI